MCSNFIEDFTDKVIEKLESNEELKKEIEKLKYILKTGIEHCSICYATNIELFPCYNCEDNLCLEHVYTNRVTLIHHTFCNEDCFSEFARRRYKF